MPGTILIVEDLFIEANHLQLLVEKAGYTVCGIAHSVEAALLVLERDKPDMVLLDIFLQGSLTGIDLAKVLRERHIAFVYLSANSNRATLEAAKATRPYGFLVKPFRRKDVLVMLEIAFYMHEYGLDSVLRRELSVEGAAEVPRPFSSNNFHGMIGQSASWRAMLHHLQVVAPSDTCVLIQGESGTGKEMIAACLHALSHRKSGPFVKVNCAALPAALIESILFGHVRGAFTGALEAHTGKFEQAHGGTLFLDEIGELPFAVQAKLLRVLQEKEIERLGSHDTIRVDVRILAATNRNLEEEVAERRFRLDLYYRLNVFPLLIPPLRERREDIALLANHFMNALAQKKGLPSTTLSPALLRELEQYDWPGNVRELEHTIERSLLLSDGGLVRKLALDAVPATAVKVSPAEGTLKTMEELERDHIVAALQRSGGKVFGQGGAAALLNMNGFTLNSRMKKLGISKNDID